GAPAYLPRTFPAVEEAIAWIHDAGGVAVWAHPFWDLDAGDEVLRSIDAFRAHGLDGVEGFYPTHDAAQARLLAGRSAQPGRRRRSFAPRRAARAPRGGPAPGPPPRPPRGGAGGGPPPPPSQPLPPLDARELAAVFAGGLAGTLARAGLAQALPHATGAWPW